MQETGNVEEQKSFAFESLAALRKKLLDLTGRNSLLNYKHPKASCIRIIDELPDQIVEVLKSEKPLILLDVPEPSKQELIESGYLSIDAETKKETKLKEHPTAEKWAKHLGFDTNYDLPNKQIGSEEKDHHQDNLLQSVLYAPQLDAHLRKIRSTAETAIEESGASILFLGIGFLEWFDSTRSDIKRMAPLYTLPVKLDRSTKISKQGKFQYSISLKDDGLITNITLKEKLANDFNLALPVVQDDISPEDYFKLVEATVIRNKPNWRIRRQASLLMLNFTKQAMYQDLDPDNWPDDAGIQDHPLIAKFFGTVESASSDNALSYQEEHLIDEIPDIHDKFPLVFDADSSQHSALIDAVNGESLVIEGPPGSGKSQTITNLIAAAISNGKKVLFVAEKMAALNVVKDRLDRAGLGDFCLELHSHKTNKVTILNTLGTRMDKQHDFRMPADIKVDIARFEDLKTKLKDYVDLVNSPWAKTDLSIHDILNKATRYREQLKINPKALQITGIDGNTFTPLRQRQLFDQSDNLKSIYDQVSQQASEGNIANHYWYGVVNTDLMGYQADDLREQLQRWTKHLEGLGKHFKRISAHLQFSVEEDVTLDRIKELTTNIKSLPELKGGELFLKLEYLIEHIENFEQWLKQYVSIHKNHNTLTPLIYKNAILEKNSVDRLSQAIKTFNQLGINADTTLEDIALLKNSVDKTREILDNVNGEFKHIIPNIPAELTNCFTPTLQGFAECKTLIRLIDGLPNDLWRSRSELYDNPDLDPLLEQMTQKLNVLTPLHKSLHDHFHFHHLPKPNVLKVYESTLNEAGLFKWFSSNWRDARNAVLSLSVIPKPNTKQLFSLIPELIQYTEGVEDIDTLNKQNDVLQDLYKGVETPILQIVKLREWYKNVRGEYGLGFGERIGTGDALLTLERNIAMSIQNNSRQQLSHHIDHIINNIHTYSEQCNGFITLQDKESDLRSSLQELSSQIEKQLVSIKPVVKENTYSINNLYEINSKLTDQQRLTDEWLDSPVTAELSEDLPLSILPNEASKPYFNAAINSLAISKVLAKDDVLLGSLLNKGDQQRYLELINSSVETRKYLQACAKAQEEFVKTGQVQVQEWMESSEGYISRLITKNSEALSKPNWLNTWLDYIRLRNKLSYVGLDDIIKGLESGLIKATQLQDVIQLCAYHQLANEIFTQNASIASFSGMEQMAYRKKFQEYDRKLMKLQRELVAYKTSRIVVPEGISSGRVGDYTQAGLIKHNLKLKRPRIAVRSLLKRAGTSIQALKPCFMMSPMSVAQYLEPGQFNFDLVVMDEASQIRPEDALGAIARGGSLVVVGDPKQLPPTSFFQKVLNNDDTEDMVGLEESESILDSVMPMFKTRRLRWHYRSRHESLIAFSNYSFYDNNLILFPSPLQKSEKFGIRYSTVAEGCFIKRRNTEEAREIIAALVKQLIGHPDESVGIVAMNSEQSDEIDLQFQAELKDNGILQKAYEKNQGIDEPLFIKNLENVQGDERDVIIISMTYGPETAGSMVMHQRFGPINSDVGWRRLNVLFTRSKMRMHIFSSMTSGHIRTSGTSSRGVVALKAFLSYCETGIVQHYEHTGKPVDSDFEIAVMDALAQRGYECEPQLGVSGYFLDIAVKDPEMPGRFLMGIECDGASYHSAKSTRDRDRLRQEILENLGWNICRIWSTDWFKNPQAQLEPIFQELDRLRSAELVQISA
jgi:very-short-patch-repair endonuclease